MASQERAPLRRAPSKWWSWKAGCRGSGRSAKWWAMSRRTGAGGVEVMVVSPTEVAVLLQLTSGFPTWPHLQSPLRKVCVNPAQRVDQGGLVAGCIEHYRGQAAQRVGALNDAVELVIDVAGAIAERVDR